jgi:NADPH-dependent glutamate synthase beta subunit-like oxidoreductase/NAD(P)H-flavin reductase
MAIRSQIFKKIFDKNRSGVQELNEKFDQFLSKNNFSKPKDENSKEYLNYAILLEKFLIQFLNLNILKKDNHIEEIYFVRRLIEKNFKNVKEYEKREIKNYLNEYDFAQKILKNEKFEIEDEQYILNILNNDLHKEYRRNSLLFSLPKIYDSFDEIIDSQTNIHDLKINDFDFSFEKNKTAIHSEIHTKYCLKCHERKKDFCRKGVEENENYKISPLKNILYGCPLDEKISEAISLKEKGFLIAALVMMMVNNPLLAITGYRICNDCAKSCIFQKQTPVDVPLIETHVLDEILKMPFGAEIYILLTQWNPLNLNFSLPNCNNKKNILVIGLGPAGISASYYLLRLGFNVIALEASRILPLKKKYSLIKNWNKACKSLENREIEGFGGVMEYGITSRWNKNLLKLMRLTLERNKNFHYFDGVRFGSNYTINDAKEDFHYVIIATGAGNQRIPINIENILARNVHLAADFLMALQLSGAYKNNEKYFSSNFQIKFPAVVIGAGLTAIDTATEILNYYPRQLLKIYHFYSNIKNKEEFEKNLNHDEKENLKEFLRQGNILKNLKNQNEIYKFLNDELGGVTVVYHKNFYESGSYKTNHEELESALRKGIKFIENLEIKKIDVNQNEEIECIQLNSGLKVKTKSLFIAYGFDSNPIVLQEAKISSKEIENFLNRTKNRNIKKYQSSIISENISVIGDMNPQYKGSVVKAILNGFYSANEIFALMKDGKFFQKKKINFKKIKNSLITKIYSIRKMNDDLYEIVIRNKQLVERIQIGQFAKFQTYGEKFSEPIMLTPIFIDEKKFLIYFVFKICGSSTYLLSKKKKGEKTIFIAPLGEKFNVENISGKKILFYCDGIERYLYLPLLKKFSEQGNEIVFITTNFKNIDNFYKKKILSYTKVVEIKKSEIEYEIEKKSKEFDFFVFGSDCENLSKLVDSEKIIKTRKSLMQCALKGVCSRCVEKKCNDGYFYNCAQSIYKKCDRKEDKNIDRTKQHSLMEKLSFAFIKD